MLSPHFSVQLSLGVLILDDGLWHWVNLIETQLLRSMTLDVQVDVLQIEDAL